MVPTSACKTSAAMCGYHLQTDFASGSIPLRSSRAILLFGYKHEIQDVVIIYMKPLWLQLALRLGEIQHPSFKLSWMGQFNL